MLAHVRNALPLAVVLLVATCAPSEAKPIEESLKSVVLIRTSVGIGTGFVVGDGTLIATNFHVIEGAKEAKAEFQDGSSAALKGFRVASPSYDLAILELPHKAPCEPFALCTKRANVGTDVFAIGAPRGLSGSVSKGVISAYRRWTDLEPLLKGQLHDFGYALESNWLQTDAAINGGNSGGPLLLATGEVTAINTLGMPAGLGQNLNFAIDASHLQKFLDELPAKASPFASLPPSASKKSGLGDRGGDTEQTLSYWKSVGKVLGVYAVEEQAWRIRDGEFRPSAGPRDGRVVGLSDERFGKTVSLRSSTIESMAKQADVPLNEAYEMDQPSLRKALRDHKADVARQEQEDRRALVRATGLGPYARQQELERQLSGQKQRNKLVQQTKLQADQVIDACTQAANDLDALATENVEPLVVAYTAALAATYRESAMAHRELFNEVQLRFTRPDPRTIQDDMRFLQALLSNVNGRLAQCAAMRDIEGAKLRRQLDLATGVAFPPVVAIPPDKAYLFEGNKIK